MLNRNKSKGFTLLELIVVVVVLGILAALAIPSFSGVKQTAAEKVAIQSAESVVRNAKALAAFDGAALNDTYLDQAGSELGVKYNATLNTVTVMSGGESARAEINPTTGAVTISGSSQVGSGGDSATVSALISQVAGWQEDTSSDYGQMARYSSWSPEHPYLLLNAFQFEDGSVSPLGGFYTNATDSVIGPGILAMQQIRADSSCVTNLEVCTQEGFGDHGVKEIADYGISYNAFEIQLYWLMKLDANGNTVPF